MGRSKTKSVESTDSRILRAFSAQPAKAYDQDAIRRFSYNYNVRLTSSGLRMALGRLVKAGRLTRSAYNRPGAVSYRLSGNGKETVWGGFGPLPEEVVLKHEGWQTFDEIFVEARQRKHSMTALELQNLLDLGVENKTLECKWQHGEKRGKRFYRPAKPSPAPTPPENGETTFFLVIANPGSGGKHYDSFITEEAALEAWATQHRFAPRLFKGVEVKPKLTGKL